MFDGGLRWERGEGTSCFLVITAFTMLLVHRIVSALIRNITKKNSGQLYFTSVTTATCADKDDQLHIDKEVLPHVETIDRDIKRLRDVGRYNKDIARNLDLGMSPEDAADGINPCKIAYACIAWQFWWITDLSGRNHEWAAVAVPLVSIAILLAGAYYIGEVVVFGQDAALWCGTLFLVVSNHSYWFQEEMVAALRMSENTWQLQLNCMFLMMPFCAYHYCGLRRAFHSWLREHGFNILLAAGQSTTWGAQHEHDYEHLSAQLAHESNKEVETVQTSRVHSNDVGSTSYVQLLSA